MIARTRLSHTVPGRLRKYIFAHESFYLEGILDDINEQDTSFLGLSFLKGYHSLVPGLSLISFYLETVWAPLRNITKYFDQNSGSMNGFGHKTKKGQQVFIKGTEAFYTQPIRTINNRL